ncbi:hypothetical protein PPACK8108_LOCUS9851, partial [Phakopsora pachyrhizi]
MGLADLVAGQAPLACPAREDLKAPLDQLQFKPAYTTPTNNHHCPTQILVNYREEYSCQARTWTQIQGPNSGSCPAGISHIYWPLSVNNTTGQFKDTVIREASTENLPTQNSCQDSVMSDVDMTETNQDLIDWSEGEEEQERKTLEERVKRLKIKKIQALPQASTSQGNIRKPHSKAPQKQAPEIEIVLDNPSREADIRKLVKAHVQNHQDFKLYQAQNQMEEARTAIKKAMDSQKTLHKLK